MVVWECPRCLPSKAKFLGLGRKKRARQRAHHHVQGNFPAQKGVLGGKSFGEPGNRPEIVVDEKAPGCGMGRLGGWSELAGQTVVPELQSGDGHQDDENGRRPKEEERAAG